jgi:SAM-dependent methyltransferase
MQERHINSEMYFKEQEITAKNYILPLLQKTIEINNETSILEIGCGNGGNLKPFLDLGCKKVVGVDLNAISIQNAVQFYSGHSNKSNIEFINSNIYDIEDLGQFDIILTKDVLEHIHGQEKFLLFVKKFLKPGGKFFLGFPPWQNPFGGHQQMCKSKILSKLPFFHILPVPLYVFILNLFGESKDKIEGLLEIKQTGISIERFEKIVKKTNYKINYRLFYFINPNYEVKFGLKPKKQLSLISAIPYLRDFLITTNYYIISKKEG